MTKSRSRVVRGSPCAVLANDPTTMYGMRAVSSAVMILRSSPSGASSVMARAAAQQAIQRHPCLMLAVLRMAGAYVLERDRARHRGHLGRCPRTLVRRHPAVDG